MPLNKKAVKPKVYLAGPLFSEAEQTFNEKLTEALEQYVEVYLPQRDGNLMSKMISKGVPIEIACKTVFNCDVAAIQDCDILIAILDGRAIDEGVAFEVGVAYSNSKLCIGLQTDSRRLASWGNNPMISGALSNTFISIDDLVCWLEDTLAEDDGRFRATA